MNDREIGDIAEQWIAAWSGPEPAAIAPGDHGDSVLDWELPNEHPELCWKVILHVLDRIEPSSATRHFQILAAGPLEELLSCHGEIVIDRMEAEAKRNPHFALLLGGVWHGNMSDDVWRRIASSAKGPW